jgi:predicted AAA+ superfamily ATPase
MRFRDDNLIKVITGLRRCGKSTLLTLISQRLLDDGVPSERIILINLESLSADTPKDSQSLYKYFQQRTGTDCLYILIDEVQRIDRWEEAVNAMRVDFACDIYVTGSNAFLLSSELATYLSGRYVEIKMLPLTFKEYLEFRGLISPNADIDQMHYEVLTDGESFFSINQLFIEYRQYGGLPYLATRPTTINEHRVYMDTLYQSVITRDILDRESWRSRRISNPDLLRRILLFLSDNIGNKNSFNSISNTLKSEKLNHSSATVEAYVSALEDAYLFYPVSRYDIKGKDYLKTLGKHYIVDLGLRNYLSGYRDTDQGRALENIIYLQLLYYGYDVSIGTYQNTEVDFIVAKPGKRVYIQVADSIDDALTFERELSPLIRIRDAYPRYVIVGRGDHPVDIEGIRIVRATDFLLQSWGEDL